MINQDDYVKSLERKIETQDEIIQNLIKSIKSLTEVISNHNSASTENSNVNNDFKEQYINDQENFKKISFLEKQIDLLQTRYDNEINNGRKERESFYKLNQILIDTFNRE